MKSFSPMRRWSAAAIVIAIVIAAGSVLAAWLIALSLGPSSTSPRRTGAAGGERGFAGLGGGGEGFAEVRPGRPLRFPADYGQHPNYRIEWWYITANLYDDAGEPFGVQWTLFRQALAPGDDTAKIVPPLNDTSDDTSDDASDDALDETGEDAARNAEVGAGSSPSSWRSRQIWMAHVAATSADAHFFEERLARGGTGQAGVRAPRAGLPFEAWLDEWRLIGAGDGFERLNVAANGKGFAYRLDLEAEGSIVPQGLGGYHVKSDQGAGPPQASYYYSQPHYRVTGSLTLNGATRAVQGLAWLDREWSSAPLAPEQVGWDWFSLHFESGEKMMLYHLRRSDGAPADIAATWVDETGAVSKLGPEQLRLSPLSDGAEGAAPRRWRIEAPDKGFAVETAPLNPAAWQESLYPYWEGPVRFFGTHRGVGYLEMTGYRE